MLNIGLIGLGPDWETQYAPALARLSPRLRVTAVYDCVAGRALQAADQLRAWPVTGIRAMLERPDIKGVLVLDAGWQGIAPIRLAIEHERPVFLAAPFDADVEELERISSSAGEAGLLLMPGLPMRCTPASARLRELTATQLGVPQRIDVRVLGNIAFNTSLLAGIIDWCAQMAQARTVEIGSIQPTIGRDAAEGVSIAAVLERGGSNPSRVAVAVRASEPSGGVEATGTGLDAFPFHATVECAHGTAHVLSAARIRWRCQADEAEEDLEKERTGLDLVLDYFARRVVGGLIPVPDLTEVCRVLRALPPERWHTGALA